MVKIVKPEDNFRGMSYGQWIEVWSNWLFSAYPRYVPDEDMLFLRGFLDFGGSPFDVSVSQYVTERGRTGPQSIGVSGPQDKDVVRITERKFILNRDIDREGVDLRDIVPLGTAVFIPLITAMYSIGHRYEGRILDNEFDLRRAVIKDTYESRGVFLLKEGKPYVKNGLVPDHLFETGTFTLRISDSSPFLGYLSDEAQPGDYESVAGGFFVILYDLEVGTHHFEFGGRGRDGYRTRTVHTVEVDKCARNYIKDISSTEPGSSMWKPTTII